MKKNTIAVISEYNPFHNGHAYQVEKIREIYPNSDIVAIMSGNFTQRGEPGILSKWARCEQALSCGVDCVVELPTLFSVMPAENFATAGVYIADKLSIVDKLYFSCECGDINILNELVNLAQSENIKKDIRTNLKSGMSYPQALQKATENICADGIVSELKKPNNILGIEYLKALKKIGSAIKPVALMRKGSIHDSTKTCSHFASGMLIRNKIFDNKFEEVKNFMPQKAYDILTKEIEDNNAPLKLKNIEKLIFYKLYKISSNEFRNIAFVSEGLENRILDNVKNTHNLTELLEKIKTKRYTYAKIKRILIYALLDITKEQTETLPSYVRILGFKKEKDYLPAKIKKYSKLPVAFTGKEILSFNKNANMIFDIENTAGNILSFCTDRIMCRNYEFTNPLVKL